jgi:signal transduction histidine kinase
MKFRRAQALLTFLVVLFFFLVIVNFLMLSYQRTVLKNSTIEHARHELELISTMAEEALLKKDYITVDSLLKKWGRKHEEIAEIRAVAPGGFIFGEYIKSESVEDIYPLERLMPFRGNGSITLEMMVDLTPVTLAIRKLNLQLVSASILFTSVLGIVLWYAMKKKALIPLEEKIIEKDAKLIESAHDWEETFDTIDDMITLHDMDMNIIRANRAAKEILQLPDLLITRTIKCFERYHGGDSPPENCPSCKSFITGKPVADEMFEPKLNKFLEIRALPRFDGNNNIIGSIHIVRDITDRKKLEEQLLHSQKMEAIGTLTGGIAHEFNNIMTSVLGFAELLRRELGSDGTVRDYADLIIKAADRASKLTSGLLAYSRKQITRREAVDVNEIVRIVAEFLSKIIGENIEIKISTSNESIFIWADKAQMEQVIMNLSTNAMDAMPDGGILSIQAEQVTYDREYIENHARITPGEYARISVSDTGIGMKKKNLEKIFEPFYTTKEVGKGTGLGLSMVYGTIKKHDGYITVDSSQGKGTVFKLFLPLRKEASERAEEVSEGLSSGGKEKPYAV